MAAPGSGELGGEAEAPATVPAWGGAGPAQAGLGAPSEPALLEMCWRKERMGQEGSDRVMAWVGLGV